ncbi:MAG: STAS domain-containing protein [bacterium]
MPHDWKQFEQPDRMTVQPGDGLMTFLQAHVATSVRISLRHQKRTDSQVLQTLLTADRAWRFRGLDFDVSNLSARLRQDFALLGLNAETTGWSGLK